MKENCNTIYNFDGGFFEDLTVIERALIKKFRKEIWTKFIKALKEYDLVQNGDKIGICISGGKDSLLLAKCFQELQKHGHLSFDIEFLAMDPGFNKVNRELLEKNCEYLNIPIKIYDSAIFEVVETIAKDYPCYMCAKMRRGFLYSKAQELGCNKIALGHHFDDVIETIMLNVMYAGNYKTMMPRLKAKNYDNMELIRPLYYVKEENIVKFAKYTGLPFMNCGCIVAAGKTSSKRSEIKKMIANLREIFPDVDKSIFKSAYNISLDAVIGYEKDGVKHYFLDDY